MIFKRILPHVLFWVLLWVAFIAIDHTGTSIYATAITELIHIVIYISLIYINLYTLIPNYLNQEKFFRYTLYLFGLVMLGTFLKIMLLYLRYHNEPVVQFDLLQNQTWIFISNFLITGSSTVFKIISDWIRHQNEKKELERQSMQSELKFLKTQINPHFLFNTLNNLYALTLKRSDLAPNIVLKLSEMMRYMLYECNEKYVPLEKEIQYMQYYIDLEKLRFGKNEHIEFIINGDTSDLKIAPLIMIPFIENAFKHGLKSSIDENAYCIINLTIRERQMEFSVVNSKPETTHDKERSGGIGLVNVQRRLNLLYPDQYQLKIKNTKDEYVVTLKLQLVQSENLISKPQLK
jgi:two-component system LytT family sensor kinase